MQTLPNRLRHVAQYTGLDGLRELLIEAAGALENAEPVAWTEATWLTSSNGHFVTKPHPSFRVPLYAAPQPQERKPLTDDEALKLIEIVGGTDETMDYDHLALARAIEAAHGIKE